MTNSIHRFALAATAAALIAPAFLSNRGTAEPNSASACKSVVVTQGGNWVLTRGQVGERAAVVFLKRQRVHDNGEVDWFASQSLKAPDDSERFGADIAIGADVVAIAAPGDPREPRSGSVYIVTFDAKKQCFKNSWIKINLSNDSSELPVAGFGSRVALSGDGKVLWIAATIGKDSPNEFVFPYGRNPDGTWTPQGAALYPDYYKGKPGGTPTSFGTSIALNRNGTWGVVGAPDDHPKSRSGSAYVFRRDGTKWSLANRIAAKDKTARDEFGSQVTIDRTGFRVAIAARKSKRTKLPAVYIFSHERGQYRQETRLLPNADDAKGFGARLTFTGLGEELFVSAPSSNVIHRFLFEKPGDKPKQKMQWLPTDPFTRPCHITTSNWGSHFGTCRVSSAAVGSTIEHNEFLIGAGADWKLAPDPYWRQKDDSGLGPLE